MADDAKVQELITQIQDAQKNGRVTFLPPEPKLKTIGWHRHRWTVWGEPFATENMWGQQVSDQQERHCTRCSRVQRRDVW